MANINANQVTRSQINADPILAATHAFDINATCDVTALQPCSSRILATHKVWVDSFRDLYPINNNATAPEAVLVGRYLEDSYFGGNPWYITTLAAAEVLYDAAAQFTKQGSVTIDETSLPFWEDIYPSAEGGTFTDESVNDFVTALNNYADGFLALIQEYTPANGTLNEQINATTGEPVSAIALTWSYAAFVTAVDRREGNFPPSWGANGATANDVADMCMASSYNATTEYSPALAAGASNVTMDCESEVLFQLLWVTGSGENTYIVGNTSILGNTLENTDDVIQVMRTNNYTDPNPEWFVPAWVPAGVPIEYKYVLLNSTDNSYTFENVTRYAYPAACGNTTVVSTLDTGSFPGRSYDGPQ